VVARDIVDSLPHEMPSAAQNALLRDGGNPRYRH
jgi:hypothetical protein